MEIYLLLIFCGIFVLAAPALAVYALLQHSKLKVNLEKLSEENRSRSTEYERQVAKLTSRIHALEMATTPITTGPAKSEAKPSPARVSAEIMRTPITTAATHI